MQAKDLLKGFFDRCHYQEEPAEQAAKYKLPDSGNRQKIARKTRLAGWAKQTYF